jgi:hypothetical protein
MFGEERCGIEADLRSAPLDFSRGRSPEATSHFGASTISSSSSPQPFHCRVSENRSNREDAVSLYLCIFDEDDELDGIAVGAYSDFGNFRDTVTKVLERGKVGSRFPILMLHSDCDGEWSAEECHDLAAELEIISAEIRRQPPTEFFSEWQKNTAKKLGLQPSTLYDCFIDVDGEPLLERLLGLVKLAQRRNLPILFQ